MRLVRKQPSLLRKQLRLVRLVRLVRKQASLAQPHPLGLTPRARALLGFVLRRACPLGLLSFVLPRVCPLALLRTTKVIPVSLRLSCAGDGCSLICWMAAALTVSASAARTLRRKRVKKRMKKRMLRLVCFRQI